MFSFLKSAYRLRDITLLVYMFFFYFRPLHSILNKHINHKDVTWKIGH
nr:MAG TPA: hypothetical protein [Caudoviricetes sp.]